MNRNELRKADINLMVVFEALMQERNHVPGLKCQRCLRSVPWTSPLPQVACLRPHRTTASPFIQHGLCGSGLVPRTPAKPVPGTACSIRGTSLPPQVAYLPSLFSAQSPTTAS
ncbi:hypothetical protein C1X72_18600 [Pseudomonas sp. FW306-2-2C-D06B]|nr:hypothetical protein C1X72_18600 [Pseudomonas sp. FW306-2-2C-D06B]PNA97901.1 hypothetical protein C1X74_13455 [Pseudomonas sp. GW460-5]PNB60454.1 hypothetical protein C1X73_08045 [Pseudomonas sp. FW305-130]